LPRRNAPRLWSVKNRKVKSWCGFTTTLETILSKIPEKEKWRATDASAPPQSGGYASTKSSSTFLRFRARPKKFSNKERRRFYFGVLPSRAGRGEVAVFWSGGGAF